MTSISLPELDKLFRIAPTRPAGKKYQPTGKRPSELGIGLQWPKDESPNAGRYGRTHTHTDRWGREISFRWSTKPNTEGYFIGWREVYCPDKRIGFRDQWRQRKARWRVKEWALKAFRKASGKDYYTLPSEAKAKRKAYRERQN